MTQYIINNINEDIWKKILPAILKEANAFSVMSFTGDKLINLETLLEKYGLSKIDVLFKYPLGPNLSLNEAYPINSDIIKLLNDLKWEEWDISKDNPEDPTFFKDKKLIFECISHENIILLYLEENKLKDLMNKFPELEIVDIKD